MSSPRYAKDPDLNLIAHRLTNATWHTELDEGEKQAAHALQMDPNTSHHLVSPMPDMKTWAVRIYLGGAQRTVGLLKGGPADDNSSAYRYADMVKMYFWKYRIRGACKPGDNQLNFSVERAEHDLANEPEVVAILQDIEKYLLDLGAIFSSEELEKRRRQLGELKSRQRTVSGAVLDSTHVLQTQMQELGELVSGAVNKQAGEVARLHTLIAELMALLKKPVAVAVADPQRVPAYIGNPPASAPETPPLYHPAHTGDPLPQQPGTVCQQPGYVPTPVDPGMFS